MTRPQGTPASKQRRRAWRITALLASGLLLALAGYAGRLLYTRNLHAVAPGQVYRSAQPTPDMLAELQASIGLRSVINLRGVWPDHDWYQAEKRSARELGLEHYDIDLRSYRLASLAQVGKLLEALDACPKPVLMHCRQGADRASLAAAIYKIVYEDASLDAASAQFSLCYGHLGIADGWRLPSLFDCYRQWLSEQRVTHSPAAFRRYVASERVIGYFGAAITPAANPQQAVPGRDALVFDVQNISHESWVLDPEDDSSIHLRVRITHPSGKQTIVFGAGPAETVAPGERVRIEAPVPVGLAEQGPHVIFADLQDRHGIHFCDMGTGGCACLLELQGSRMR